MYALLIRLRVRWLRNLLTVLQVAVATAAVTAVVTTVLPALRQTGMSDPDVYAVAYGVRTETSSSSVAVFSLEDVAYLEEHADALVAVSVYDIDVNALVRVGDERYVLRSIGLVGPEYAAVMDLEMVRGAFFTRQEVHDAAPVAVISDQLAQILFGTEDAVGRTINIRPHQEFFLMQGSVSGLFDAQAVMAAPGTDVRVVGVFRYREQQTASMREAVPHLLVPVTLDTRSVANFLQAAPIAVVEGNAAQAVVVEGLPEGVAWPVAPVMRRAYSHLVVRVREGMAAQAENEVKALLRSLIQSRPEAGPRVQFGEEGLEPDVHMYRFGSEGTASLAARLEGAMLSGAMGLAALVAAGFAVFATATASVAERTRSIALARALGATRSRIVKDVLSEALILSGFGGLVGAAASYPLGKFVLLPLQFAAYGQEFMAVDLVAAGGIGTLLAVAVGAAAALYPGWTVARLMPAEAWREGRV